MVNSQADATVVFAALADPIRRRILLRLSTEGEGAVTVLAKPFRVSAPAISRHLRVLEKARLIGRRQEGRVHIIRAVPAGLKPAQDWITRYAAGLNFSLDVLDRLLKNETRKVNEE